MTDPITREQLTAVPDARARADLLGIDYEAVVAATNTAQVAAPLAVGVPSAIAVFIAASGGWLSDWPAFGYGAIAGVSAALIGSLLPGVISWAVLRLPVVAQQALTVPVGAAATVLLLWVAVLLNPSQSGLIGCAVGAALGGTLGIAAHLGLPRSLQTNSRRLVGVVRQLQSYPQTHSVLGGSVRWLLTDYLCDGVRNAALVVLLATWPDSLALVLGVVVVLQTGAAILVAIRRAKLGTLVKLAVAVLLIAVAVFALLTSPAFAN